MTSSRRKPNRLASWLLLVGGLAAFGGYLFWAGRQFMLESGYTPLGAHGWTAMTLGLVGTAVLAAVLMWLMFFSARKGFDDGTGGEDDEA